MRDPMNVNLVQPIMIHTEIVTGTMNCEKHGFYGRYSQR
jgi:hypothetical protein